MGTGQDSSWPVCFFGIARLFLLVRRNPASLTDRSFRENRFAAVGGVMAAILIMPAATRSGWNRSLQFLGHCVLEGPVQPRPIIRETPSCLFAMTSDKWQNRQYFLQSSSRWIAFAVKYWKPVNCWTRWIHFDSKYWS